MSCYYCSKPKYLRPCGPNGAMVCFKCAMSAPDLKAEAERHLGMQLDACGLGNHDRRRFSYSVPSKARKAEDQAVGEPVKRYDRDGVDCSVYASPAKFVLASDYDALAQRCRELEANNEAGAQWLEKATSALRSEEADNDTLRAEVADLKARLLEAERGNEELVRLRAEKRELIERIQQIVTHPHESTNALAARVRNILEAAACASTTGDTPAA